MHLQLIQGQFSADDAIEILTQMVQVKIKFHEGKIHDGLNEEDIKTRENRIKELQKELFEIRKLIAEEKAAVKMNALVEID